MAPASANTVAKLALGISDNQALTTACEAIGGQAVPIMVFPVSTPPTAVTQHGMAIWLH